MSRKKQPKADNKEQSARFIEKAMQIELTENPEEVFEKTMKKVIKTKPIKKSEKMSP